MEHIISMYTYLCAYGYLRFCLFVFKESTVNYAGTTFKYSLNIYMRLLLSYVQKVGVGYD